MMIPASAQATKRFQIYIFQIFLFHGLYRSYERVNLLFCCEEAEREPNGALKGRILQMPVDQGSTVMACPHGNVMLCIQNRCGFPTGKAIHILSGARYRIIRSSCSSRSIR